MTHKLNDPLSMTSLLDVAPSSVDHKGASKSCVENAASTPGLWDPHVERVQRLFREFSSWPFLFRFVYFRFGGFSFPTFVLWLLLRDNHFSACSGNLPFPGPADTGRYQKGQAPYRKSVNKGGTGFSPDTTLSYLVDPPTPIRPAL